MTSGQHTSAKSEAPAWTRAMRARVDAHLEELLDRAALPERLDDAMRYALLAGGKRLRPILALASARAVGGDESRAMPAAAAVEMVHAFSLVHDDLPALDDDDVRRGRPTLHVRSGEATAILAGDGLMSLAFQTISTDPSDPALSGSLVSELSLATTRMIGGQALDTLGEQERGDAGRLVRQIHEAKTGALIRASCVMGALSALWPCEEGDERLDCIRAYAERIGLMFQIVDDLIDVEQSPEHSGKATRKDEAAGKLTYPAVLGVQASREEVRRLEREAIEAIEPLGPSAAPLRELGEHLARRTR